MFSYVHMVSVSVHKQYYIYIESGKGKTYTYTHHKIQSKHTHSFFQNYHSNQRDNSKWMHTRIWIYNVYEALMRIEVAS